MSCRHSSAWLICGGTFSWCPDCGAIRKMQHTSPTGVEYLWKRWVYPKGQTSALAALDREGNR